MNITLRHLFAMAFCAFISTASANASILFHDDFESDVVNQWPTGWTGFGGNESNYSTNRVEVDPTPENKNQVFRLTGVVGSYWGAGAVSEVDFTDHFQITLNVYNDGRELPSSGHKFKGSLTLRQGERWTNPDWIFFEFWKNNQIKILGNYVAEYQNNQWYKVSVEYHLRNDNELRLMYHINGDPYGPFFVPIDDAQYMRAFDHINLISAASSAYFDNITVTAIPEPSAVHLAWCALIIIGALIFGVAFIKMRRHL